MKYCFTKLAVTDFISQSTIMSGFFSWCTTNNNELNKMTKLIVEKADENKIYFSEDDKCKLITINKRKGEEEEKAVMELGTVKLKKVTEATVLGYTFNEEGNNSAHIEQKQQKNNSNDSKYGLIDQNHQHGEHLWTVNAHSP